MKRVAVRIDADVGLRELQRAADIALAADETCDGVAVAVERGQRGRLVELGAHAALHLDRVVEGQKFLIIRFLAAAREKAGDAARGRDGADPVGRAEQQRVAALAEGDDENEFAGLRAFQRMREHHQRMGRARVAADHRKIVAQRRFRDARLPGNGARDLGERAGHDEMRDVGARHPCRGKQVLQRRGHDLVVALVADPALFPGVVIGDAVAAIVIDEIDRARGVRDEFGDHVAFADEQGRRAVA